MKKVNKKTAKRKKLRHASTSTKIIGRKGKTNLAKN